MAAPTTSAPRRERSVIAISERQRLMEQARKRLFSRRPVLLVNHGPARKPERSRRFGKLDGAVWSVKNRVFPPDLTARRESFGPPPCRQPFSSILRQDIIAPQTGVFISYGRFKFCGRPLWVRRSLN